MTLHGGDRRWICIGSSDIPAHSANGWCYQLLSTQEVARFLSYTNHFERTGCAALLA